MLDEEVEFFLKTAREGGIEPPEWTGNVTADLAVAAIDAKGGGQSQWYHDINPKFQE